MAPKEGALFPRPADSKTVSSTETQFDFHWRAIQSGQEVWIPLPPGQPHVIELEYHDDRRTGDLLFSARKAGTSDAFQLMRGDTLWPKREQHELRTNEKGEPWIENPIRVQVDIVYPQGSDKTVHRVGMKFVDPHMVDAWGVEGTRTPEVDNIFTGYGHTLPDEPLPPGTWLRLTVQRPNAQPWEKDLPALKLNYVRPHVIPPYGARKEVYRAKATDPKTVMFEGEPYGALPPKGYKLPLDPNRKVAALLVRWTDQGGPYSGAVRWTTADGEERESKNYWIGSGETELIPLDDTVPKDGVVTIVGPEAVRVHSIEVLYTK